MTTTTEQIEKTNHFHLTDGKFATFQWRLAKLQKTARKLGVAEPTFRVVREYMRDPEPHPSTWVNAFDTVSSYAWAKLAVAHRPKVHVQVIEVIGSAPEVPGFAFIGKVEPSQVEGVNFVKGIPGRDDDMEKFRGIDMECEHCELKRYRKHVFVILDTDSGSTHVVGKTCLKDFTGHANPESLAQFGWELSRLFDCENDDDWNVGARWKPSFATEWFVSMVVALTEEHGYRSGETRDLTLAALTGAWPFNGEKGSIPVPAVTDKHVEAGGVALAWARSLATDSHANGNSYLLNLRLAVAGDLVGAKEWGLAASVVQAHARHLERAVKRDEIQAEREAAKPLPKFEGRVEIEGKIVSAKWKDTDFGESLKIVVKHADGWAVWGSCPSALGRNEQDLIGKGVRFHAAVKRADKGFGFFSRPTKAAFV